MKRKSYTLTDAESRDFDRLPPFEGFGLKFWQRVADARGLDAATIISEGRQFTALTLGHGKQWCFPHALKCLKKPPKVLEGGAA